MVLCELPNAATIAPLDFSLPVFPLMVGVRCEQRQRAAANSRSFRHHRAWDRGGRTADMLRIDCRRHTPAPMLRRSLSPLRGADEQAISFSRCDPHPSHRHATRISSLSAPIFARERRRWTPVSSRSALRATIVRKKKARKRNADRRVSNLRTFRVRRAQSAARSPLGVPPRLSANGTIHPKAQPGPGFVTHLTVAWHFQRCTSRAGHSAGRLMPRPPGSGSDEPPPAGTVSRSAGQSH